MTVDRCPLCDTLTYPDTNDSNVRDADLLGVLNHLRRFKVQGAPFKRQCVHPLRDRLLSELTDSPAALQALAALAEENWDEDEVRRKIGKFLGMRWENPAAWQTWLNSAMAELALKKMGGK